MFLQRSRFPVWEWPPEGRTSASSSPSCYLQVKGDGLLPRISHYHSSGFTLRATRTWKEQRWLFEPQVITGLKNTNEMMQRKWSVSREFKFLNYQDQIRPRRTLFFQKDFIPEQMERPTMRSLSLGLTGSFSPQWKGNATWFLSQHLTCTRVECSTFSENVKPQKRLFDRWNQSENQPTSHNIMNKEDLTGSQSFF